MPNLNKILVMGFLTRDPELRFTTNNMAVANCCIAVNRRWKDKNSGETRQETVFLEFEAFGGQAQTINDTLTKGRPIFIEGRVKLDEWETDGEKKSRFKIVVERFEFVDSKADAAMHATPEKSIYEHAKEQVKLDDGASSIVF